MLISDSTLQGLGSSFRLGGRGGGGGGLKAKAEGPRKFLNVESGMPFPGLWGRFDRILIVRK